MLCVVLFVFTLTKGCQGDGDNSSTEEPMLLIPPPVISRRMSSDLVNKLRRQLMRDNYDYQNPNDDDRKKSNNTQWNAGAKGGSVNSSTIPRTLENTQASSNAFTEDQHDQPEQPGVPDEQADEHERLSEQEQQQTGPEYLPPPTDENDERDVSPDRRDNKPYRVEAYNPSSYNKRRDAYDTPFHPAQMQVAPVRNPRGKDLYEQDRDDAGDPADEGDAGKAYNEQEEQEGQSRMESDAQDNPDQEFVPDQQDATDQQDAPDQQDVPDQQDIPDQQDFPDQQDVPNEQEASEQQDPSGQQDDEEADNQEKKSQDQVMYDMFGAQGMQRPLVTRANRLQYYQPIPTENSPPPLPPRRDHNISKKDLLYYMDDNQLRRNNIMSADVYDTTDLQAEDEPTQPRPSASISPTTTRPSTMPRVATTVAPVAYHPRTRAPHSIVVTVSANNVTYKLLTMKTHEGRRSGARRFLEERAPNSVALISLDHAPMPAFRLPRKRRQYMHEPHDHRSPLGELLPHHHRRQATG